MKIRNHAVKSVENNISDFKNNVVTKKQVTKIKGGSQDFVITEDCIDL